MRRIIINYITMLTVIMMAFTSIPVFAEDNLKQTESTEVEAPEVITELEAPQEVVLSCSDNGVLLTWIEVSDAEGYYINRKDKDSDSWENIATVAAEDGLSWEDNNVAAGYEYVYSVQAYSKEIVSGYSEEKTIFIFKDPQITKWSRTAPDKMLLNWDVDSAVDGYEIEYATDTKFKTPYSFILNKPAVGVKEITGLYASKNYYVRIRAFYKLIDGTTCFSQWNVFDGKRNSFNLYGTIFKKNGSVFEVRSQAKQKLYQYDVLQGVCTDGKYDYYILYHKSKENCRIVKVRRSDLKVIKVSKTLDLHHGNDITYNSRTNKLIVVHNTRKPKRLSVVNPSTLVIERNIDVKIPSVLPGATKSDRDAIKGFGGIAYNSTRNQYILRISLNYNFLVLDSNFRPLYFAKASKKYKSCYQGIDATSDYVFVVQTPKSGGITNNLISVYDWGGNHLYNVNVNKAYELEGIYHIGSAYYGGFYHSYYKTAYKYKTVKVKKKWKKVKGKWKYKYKKKKVKVKYKKLIRSNYMYKLGNIS